ncbi:MAG: response regulator [Acidimicrobiia bacterium]|nr:response regulator [Acidimicrobiia bacterium]
MQTRTVLVVEDADATRRLLEVALMIDGFDVIQHTDGASGLEAARSLLPDVIVLDVALPEMDGWEVLGHLRMDPKTREIPVVVVTAHDTAETRSKANFATADAFVGKPFDLNQLRAVVADLVERRNSQTAPVG